MDDRNKELTPPPEHAAAPPPKPRSQKAVYAEPFAANTGSRKALEKAGFELEGILRNSVYKNGRMLDSCIYARLKETG